MSDGREASKRRLLFGALYFAEGAPIGFLWLALPTFLREGGADVAEITSLTAALALPWSLKFLAAPLVDLSGGRYRGWIVAAQCLMALTLVPLALFEWQTVPWWLTAVLLLHACSAAMQDVSIDAYAVAVAPPRERGSLNAAMQTGMLSGRWLFGAGLLIAAGSIGARTAVWGMILCLALTSATALAAVRRPPQLSRAHEGAYWGRVRRMAASRTTWMGLLLTVIGGAGYETVGVLAGPLLIDRGFSSGVAGTFFSSTVVLMAAGAWAGGRLADRLGALRAVKLCLPACAAAVLGAAAAGDTDGPALFAALGAVYLTLGGFTASSYALLMNLTDPALGGLQFSLFMAGTNLCEAWAGFSGGRIASEWGYPSAFALTALASLAAWPALSDLQRALALRDNA